MDKKTFHIISLGCAKNTVDSESMAQMLINSGFKRADGVKDACILVVNTCGFIAPAKEESLKVLSDLIRKKKSGQKLIAAGCLTQRYGVEIPKSLPGIDAVLGTRRWMDIVKVIENPGRDTHQIPHVPLLNIDTGDEVSVPRFSVQGASAYLKIADGCRRPCTFCAIPLIKGTAVSRPMESILSDVRKLETARVREIILIAQDTTDYGYDIGLKNGLSTLIKKISEAAPDADWLRIMYAYPGYVKDDLIEVMATNRQVVHYLDMPLQHIHPKILGAMKRPTNITWIFKTVEKMRKLIPDLAIRTTFIVGFPGETEAQFQTLLDFIQEMRFDKVGAFKFSFEPGTACEPLGDPIPDEVKDDRLRRLMETQQKISFELNKDFIGSKLDVLIEGCGKGISFGRSYRDAPEIDGLVLVKGENPVGQMIKVKIIEAGVYDLSGVRISNRT
jgi:ribosomal protein S12 methylthiotransferase